MIITALNVNLFFVLMLINIVHISRLNYLIIKQCVLDKNFLKAFNDFKNKGNIFNHTAEMNIITIADKLDMSDDFYTKHNMPAVEGKLNAMIKKNKSLINKLNRNW